jgi:hypothetical protein
MGITRHYYPNDVIVKRDEYLRQQNNMLWLIFLRMSPTQKQGRSLI